MLHWRTSIEADIKPLAWKIRWADRREIKDVAGHSPVAAFTQGYEESLRPLTILKGTQPVAMCGAVPMGPSDACIWLLGTDGINEDRVSFIRNSKAVLEELCKPFDLVYNAVDKRNTLHIRWLQWMGFTFLNETIINNTPVYEFARIC